MTNDIDYMFLHLIISLQQSFNSANVRISPYRMPKLFLNIDQITDEQPHLKLIKTPKGHLILINDELLCHGKSDLIGLCNKDYLSKYWKFYRRKDFYLIKSTYRRYVFLSKMCMEFVMGRAIMQTCDDGNVNQLWKIINDSSESSSNEDDKNDDKKEQENNDDEQKESDKSNDRNKDVGKMQNIATINRDLDKLDIDEDLDSKKSNNDYILKKHKSSDILQELKNKHDSDTKEEKEYQKLTEKEIQSSSFNDNEDSSIRNSKESSKNNESYNKSHNHTKRKKDCSDLYTKLFKFVPKKQNTESKIIDKKYICDSKDDLLYSKNKGLNDNANEQQKIIQTQTITDISNDKLKDQSKTLSQLSDIVNEIANIDGLSNQMAEIKNIKFIKNNEKNKNT